MRTALTTVGFLLLTAGIVLLITGPEGSAGAYIVTALVGLVLSAAGVVSARLGGGRRHGRRRRGK